MPDIGWVSLKARKTKLVEIFLKNQKEVKISKEIEILIVVQKAVLLKYTLF